MNHFRDKKKENVTMYNRSEIWLPQYSKSSYVYNEGSQHMVLRKNKEKNIGSL